MARDGRRSGRKGNEQKIGYIIEDGMDLVEDANKKRPDDVAIQ